MKNSYEKRIAELELITRPIIKVGFNLDIKEIEEYNVFVSHTLEDKESFVDELIAALRSNDIKVWYDTTQIKWDDSLREKIDDGLKKSKFGIVILSPSYIADGKY